MRSLLGFPVISGALAVGLALASAQQAEKAASPAEKGAQEKAQQSESGRAGTTEPSSELPTATPMNAAPFVNGSLTAPGAPADSQTVPAKYSERNAALDALPTMAFPLHLDDKQRQRIREAVSQAPVANATAQPADLLPPSIELREVPSNLVSEIPAVRDLGFVRTEKGILLVKALDRIVVEEIPAR